MSLELDVSPIQRYRQHLRRALQIVLRALDAGERSDVGEPAARRQLMDAQVFVQVSGVQHMQQVSWQLVGLVMRENPVVPRRHNGSVRDHDGVTPLRDHRGLCLSELENVCQIIDVRLPITRHKQRLFLTRLDHTGLIQPVDHM